jgi:hypothetical protein
MILKNFKYLCTIEVNSGNGVACGPIPAAVNWPIERRVKLREYCINAATCDNLASGYNVRPVDVH